MKRRLSLAAICALAAFVATPAWACFGPYSRQLLDEVPDNAPAGTSVIRVDFTNQGAEVQAWRSRMPERLGSMSERRGMRRWFVGIARRIDGHSDGVFPIYARISSCTPDFDGPQALPAKQVYLVGRFRQIEGQRIFIVFARGADGEWETLEPAEFSDPARL